MMIYLTYLDHLIGLIWKHLEYLNSLHQYRLISCLKDWWETKDRSWKRIFSFLLWISFRIHVHSVKKNLDGWDNLRGGETILTQVDQRVQHPEHDHDDPDDDDDGWWSWSWWFMMINDDCWWWWQRLWFWWQREQLRPLNKRLMNDEVTRGQLCPWYWCW